MVADAVGPDHIAQVGVVVVVAVVVLVVVVVVGGR